MQRAQTNSTVKKLVNIQSIFLVLLGTLAISLSGMISIPLPFSPVPLALQPSVALLVGALLGVKRGGLAISLFLLQGALGLPVFAMGASSLLHLVGPRGGYLIGYLFGGVLAGYLTERKWSLFSSVIAGNLVVYFLGALQLAGFIGIQSAILLGVAPFILGDVLKAILLTKLFSKKVSKNSI